MSEHESREAPRVRFAKIIIETQLLAGLLDCFTYEEAAPAAFAAADRILAILPAAPVVAGDRERVLEEAATELDDYAEAVEDMPRDADVIRECAAMVRACSPFAPEEEK